MNSNNKFNNNHKTISNEMEIMNSVLNYEGHDYSDLESSKMYLDKASKCSNSHRS